MTIKTNQKKFWAYNDIFDVLGNTLKPTGIAVYLCLIRHADRNAQCYPSHKLIATKCGISRRTVVTAISKLLKLDLIKVQKRETNNGGDTSNLYIIKKLPNHINTEKEVPPPAQEIHKDPEKIAHPPVQNLHTPCEKIAHEGQLTEGQLYLKDDDTKDRQALNNKVDLSELKSPILLSQQMVKALNKLPNNKKRQEVLDVLAISMKKGAIRKPEAYLQTLIQRSLADDFTPIKPQNSLKDKVDSKQEQKKAIEQCPYCDQSGYIHIRYTNGNFNHPRCSHPQYINWDKDDIYEIRTASSGHKSKEEENRELISKNKSTVKQRNVAELLRQVIKKIPVYESDDPNKNYTSEESVPF